MERISGLESMFLQQHFFSSLLQSLFLSLLLLPYSPFGRLVRLVPFTPFYEVKDGIHGGDTLFPPSFFLCVCVCVCVSVFLFFYFSCYSRKTLSVFPRFFLHFHLLCVENSVSEDRNNDFLLSLSLPLFLSLCTDFSQILRDPTMNSKGEIRRSIVDLNPLIVCTLCQGYFIDPVTLVECLHSFCKTCIMKHVEKNEVCCPICDTLIHKTKPFSSMREDKTLQDIVYKIVPGLHHNEMLRRKKFYATHPSKGKVPDLLERELRNKIFFNQEDKFSISIQYFDPSTIKKEASTPPGDRTNPNKRYLECPGPMQVCHLKKFIAMKYGLNLESFMIDIIYKDDLIPNHYTLIDIAYNYNWKKDHPMQFFYRIFKKSKVLLKRKRKTSCVEEKCNDGSHIQITEATSPKKCKSDPGEIKSPRSTNGSLGPEKLPSSNDLSPQKEESVTTKKIKSSVNAVISSSVSTKTSTTTTSSSSSSHHKVVKAALSTSKSVSASSNREKVSGQSKDSLPKIIVTSKQPPQKESLKVVSTPASVSQVTKSPLTSVAKGGGGSSNGATCSPGRDRPITTTGGTIQTSIISKEDKNGKTLIIRKSPITSASVKLSNSSSLSTTSKVTVNSDGTKSVLKKVPQVSATTSPRPILPKSDKVVTDSAKKEGDKKSLSVAPPVPSSDVNGNSEVTKVVSNNNNNSSANSQSSHHPKSTPNSQNNLSNIVKSLTAKKKLEDSQSSSSSTTSKAAQNTSSSKQESKTEKGSSNNAESKKFTEKPVAASPPKAQQQEKSELTKDANKTTANSVIEKKSNASAEAIAQSIIANYAIAAAAQQAAAVNAHQVLTNQLSLSRGAYPGAYEHLLRPPYVKVTDPSLKMPMMSSNNNSPSSSSSSPTAGGGAGSGSQIPNTNRLQFKVQASPSNTNLTSIFSNTKQLPTDIKSLFGASVKKFNSNVPKALNQSIRQIPNPSLLTNKGNNSVQKK